MNLTAFSSTLFTRIETRARRVARRLLGRPDHDSATAAAAAFWDRQAAAPSAIYWTQHPLIQEYVNILITGVRWLSPTQGLKAGWAYKPLGRGVSLGCGAGALERDIYYQRICHQMDGFDISPHSIRVAKSEAKKERMQGLHYEVRNCNEIRLRPERYDIAFFHGSLHHITDPDAVLERVLEGLKPQGLLYVDEYTGPSRFEWVDDAIASEALRPVREVYDTLDDELKIVPVNPPIDMSDPSEMIRSSRIRGAIEDHFEVLHYKPYWGNLLYPLLCTLDGEKMLKPERRGLVEELIEKEKALVADGTFRESMYSVFVARKRQPSA